MLSRCNIQLMNARLQGVAKSMEASYFMEATKVIDSMQNLLPMLTNNNTNISYISFFLFTQQKSRENHNIQGSRLLSRTFDSGLVKAILSLVSQRVRTIHQVFNGF